MSELELIRIMKVKEKSVKLRKRSEGKWLYKGEHEIKVKFLTFFCLLFLSPEEAAEIKMNT